MTSSSSSISSSSTPSRSSTSSTTSSISSTSIVVITPNNNEIINPSEDDDREEFRKFLEPDRKDLERIFYLTIKQHESELNQLNDKRTSNYEVPLISSPRGDEVVNRLSEQFGLTPYDVRSKLREIMISSNSVTT